MSGFALHLKNKKRDFGGIGGISLIGVQKNKKRDFGGIGGIGLIGVQKNKKEISVVSAVSV